MEKLSPNARRLLESLRQEGGDGYSLMKRSSNTALELINALKELPPSMLIVKGALNENQVGESFIALSPDAKGDASMLLMS